MMPPARLDSAPCTASVTAREATLNSAIMELTSMPSEPATIRKISAHIKMRRAERRNFSMVFSMRERVNSLSATLSTTREVA